MYVHTYKCWNVCTLISIKIANINEFVVAAREGNIETLEYINKPNKSTPPSLAQLATREREHRSSITSLKQKERERASTSASAPKPPQHTHLLFSLCSLGVVDIHVYVLFTLGATHPVLQKKRNGQSSAIRLLLAPLSPKVACALREQVPACLAPYRPQQKRQEKQQQLLSGTAPATHPQGNDKTTTRYCHWHCLFLFLVFDSNH